MDSFGFIPSIDFGATTAASVAGSGFFSWIVEGGNDEKGVDGFGCAGSAGGLTGVWAVG